MQRGIEPARIAELAEQAAAGDEAAFTEWVRLTYPLAFRVVSSMLVSRADTEDTLQDAYTKAWEKLPGLRQKETSVAWLLTMCRRASIDALRKRRPWDSLDAEESRAIASALVSNDEPAEALLLKEEARALLAKALSLLPEKYRDIIVLRELEGISGPELVKLLGVPIGTIESQTHRGKQALAKILEGLSEGSA
jgi:RNA polymerase sigma-70 factor (ECF subfamily)